MEWTQQQEVEALKNAYDTIAKVRDRPLWSSFQRPRPLSKKEEIDELIGSIDSIGHYIDSDTRRTKGQGQPPECYGFIPWPNSHFIKVLLHVLQHQHKHHPSKRKLRFLNAGCGMGLKVIIAEAMGCIATGLEISPKLIEKGKKFFSFNSRHPRLQQGDIRSHDYGEYDIIFFYCPLRSVTQEELFEHRVWEQCKVGAYVIGQQGLTRPPRRFDDVGEYGFDGGYRANIYRRAR